MGKKESEFFKKCGISARAELFYGFFVESKNGE